MARDAWQSVVIRSADVQRLRGLCGVPNCYFESDGLMGLIDPSRAREAGFNAFMLFWHDTWKTIRFDELREARSTKLRDQKPVICAGTHLPLVSGHRAE